MTSWKLPKDPNDVCDYQFDWSERLEEGETIATSVFLVSPDTLTIDGELDDNPPSIDGALTTFWASGGVDGQSYIITNRITTSEGRTYDWSSRLRVRETG